MGYEAAFFELLPKFITFIIAAVFFYMLTKAWIKICGNVFWGTVISVIVMTVIYLGFV